MHGHWERWTSDENRYVISDAPSTPEGMYRYWQLRIERMKNVMAKRPMFLHLQVSDHFGLSHAGTVRYFAEGTH